MQSVLPLSPSRPAPDATPPTGHAPVVLLNPHAQSGRLGKRRPLIEACLTRWSPGAELHVSQSVDHALRTIASLDKGRRVLVVGGDGSLNRLLPALLEGGHTLGIVAHGSGNDTARAVGAPWRDWQACLKGSLAGPGMRMDLGEARIDGEWLPFVSSVTFGFDSVVGTRAQRSPSWLRGMPRYLLATLAELANLPHWHMQIQVDGREVWSAPTLLASTLNTPNYGGGIPAVPHARFDDGMLDVLLAPQLGKAEVLGLLQKMTTGQHLTDPRIQTHAYRKLRIQSDRLLPVLLDGECRGSSRDLEIRVRPAALEVVGGEAWASAPVAAL